MTSTPPWNTGSSSTAINCSPILLFSLFTLSIMRITIFVPVGIVQAVLAAFEDVGCVTRAVPGNNRGSDELFSRDGAGVTGCDADDAVDFSSPN